MFMRVTPLDLRQTRFRSVFRGFDRAEVVTFMAEAADDYEQALREIEGQRQELARMEGLLSEHREREANLCNTLLTAQKVADEVRENAKQEARMIVREAQGRADLLLQKSQGNLEQLERAINELRLKRRNVETSLEASIAALHHALEFTRAQDQSQRDDKVRLHRPRQTDREAPAAHHTAASPTVAGDRQA